MRRPLFGLIVSACAASSSVAATSVSINIELDDAGLTAVDYQCSANNRLSILYVTSENDILALVPIDGEPRVFVNAVSGSGARYVAGQYEWWSKGTVGGLRDVMSDEVLLDCEAVE